MSRVLVFCETDEHGIRKGSRQALGAARRIEGAQVEALLIGRNAAALASKTGELGAKKAIVVACDSDYSTALWTAAAAVAAGSGECVFLASHTAISKDFAPRLAARMGCAHIADAIEITGKSGELEFRRPIYAGKAFEQVKVAEGRVVATLRPNAFAEEANTAGGSVEIVNQAAPDAQASLMTVIKETIKAAGEEIELTEADVVVSGGIGVGGPEGFNFLKPLCKELGAALGASRAAVLAGWIAPDHQVGQTGKTVSPQLYVACGISGAIQHRAGMSSSKVIVAINKDPQAPIFEIADYGIVGDLFQVIPPFLEAVKKIKAS
ncbi:electron transfer flavoprotein subunit alpha/FixB family protein [Candidatus Sumerlaeota bacterium]|nr:electron transfer flavoprotein subunit alpha/FixB family protein [Candidatus Sumerlaeota bacterium]